VIKGIKNSHVGLFILANLIKHAFASKPTDQRAKVSPVFFEERANSREEGTDIADDIDVLVGALKDCAVDLYSCLLLPLVRDPKDPYLLAALGTTIFSGNLIAQTALRKSQPVAVVEDPGRNQYLPILLDNDNDPALELARSESGDISDEVSILISRAEASGGELTFSGDTTSTRPTDISAVGQESASDSLADIGLKQRRRTFGGKQKAQSREAEENKKVGERRRSGGGRQKGGRGRNKKSARKTGGAEAERKLKKGKRPRKAAESRKGLASIGKLKKQGNHFNSTNALVSSVANSILRDQIGSSLKKSEGWNKNQLKDLNDETNEPGGLLGNFPGCGSSRLNKDSNQHPWLGALFAVQLDPAKETEDRFVAPVALLSAKTKLQPNWPTVIVATGDIFDSKIMNSSSSTVSSEDLVSWGMRLEVRFALESASGPIVLPVTMITFHPGFVGQGEKKKEHTKELAAIDVDSANLWHSSPLVRPLCLPDFADQNRTVTQVGWDNDSSKLGDKLLKSGDLGPPIAVTTKLEECEQADTHLCLSSSAGFRGPGWGSLIVSTNESLDRVSLVGFTQRRSPQLPREGAEGGSRIFCHLSWLAKLYNRTWPHSDICDQKL